MTFGETKGRVAPALLVLLVLLVFAGSVSANEVQSRLFTAVLPMADLGLTGVVRGQPASFEGSGISDPRFRLAVNLFGAPALDPRAYREYRQCTIFGVNLEVTAPLGEYRATSSSTSAPIAGRSPRKRNSRVGGDFDHYNLAYTLRF